MRTPPKYENAPFIPPLGNEATPIDNKPIQGEDPPPPSSAPSSAQPSELNRVQVLQIHSSDVRSSNKEPQQPKRDDRSSINVASHRVPPQQSDAQVGRRNQKRDRQGGGRGQDGRHGNGQQQQARKAPSRDLIDEFMKPPTANVVSMVCQFLFLSLSLFLHLSCTCTVHACTLHMYICMYIFLHACISESPSLSHYFFLFIFLSLTHTHTLLSLLFSWCLRTLSLSS